eukprot:m.16692 g.16692  ORF g.16692 m.16692 type:complete len:133 (+) comp5767_c0_seq1:84-482(+)
MLSAIVKQHQQEQAELKRKNEESRIEATNAAHSLTKETIASLNEGVVHVFNTQKKLEGEVKHLQTSLVKYTKLSSQWITMVDNFNLALKEIGDVENWAQRIESDMHAIAEGLDFVRREIDSDGGDEATGEKA